MTKLLNRYEKKTINHTCDLRVDGIHSHCKCNILFCTCERKRMDGFLYRVLWRRIDSQSDNYGHFCSKKFQMIVGVSPISPVFLSEN